jgi:hypothetical protein
MFNISFTLPFFARDGQLEAGLSIEIGSSNPRASVASKQQFYRQNQQSHSK